LIEIAFAGSAQSVIVQQQEGFRIIAEIIQAA
jgi:hypothetical protein